MVLMQVEGDADDVARLAAGLGEKLGGARQDVLVLLLQRWMLFASHAGEEHHRSPGEIADEGLLRLMLDDVAGGAVCGRPHGDEIERDVGARFKPRRRDEPRWCGG